MGNSTTNTAGQGERPHIAERGEDPERALARAILARESAAGGGLGLDADASAFRKLQASLSRMVGAGGFQAMLSRSLAVTTSQHPRVAALRIEPGGALKAVPGAALIGASQFPEADSEECVALISDFLSLLAIFIGSSMASRIVRTVWPDVEAGTESRAMD